MGKEEVKEEEGSTEGEEEEGGKDWKEVEEVPPDISSWKASQPLAPGQSWKGKASPEFWPKWGKGEGAKGLLAKGEGESGDELL